MPTLPKYSMNPHLSSAFSFSSFFLLPPTITPPHNDLAMAPPSTVTSGSKTAETPTWRFTNVNDLVDKVRNTAGDILVVRGKFESSNLRVYI